MTALANSGSNKIAKSCLVSGIITDVELLQNTT